MGLVIMIVKCHVYTRLKHNIEKNMLQAFTWSFFSKKEKWLTNKPREQKGYCKGD